MLISTLVLESDSISETQTVATLVKKRASSNHALVPQWLAHTRSRGKVKKNDHL
jgi:hypothetical protein